MSAIITADTHWNDNPREEFRWGLIDWLCEQQADELLILGDLTVAKNNHPAQVVNRLVDGFTKLSNHYQMVYVLKGNHDL
jgi:UDP-2,3-diacylglucosamine pyrophosphatase LpxH